MILPSITNAEWCAPRPSGCGGCGCGCQRYCYRVCRCPRCWPVYPVPCIPVYPDNTYRPSDNTGCPPPPSWNRYEVTC